VCLSSIHRDLSNLISQFFLPPLPDPRSGWIATTANVSAQEQDLDDDDGVESIETDEESEEGLQHTLEAHIAGLKSVESREDAEVDNSTNVDTANNTSIEIDNDDDQFDNMVKSSDTFQQFKSLIQETDTLREILAQSYKLMRMLTLGCDKGSIDIASKFKSRSEHWFGSKKSLGNNSNGDQPGPDESLLRLRRNSIIVLRVNRGGHEMLLEYQALASFIKYYGKWFVSIPNDFFWNKENKLTIPKERVLARLVKGHGDF
jgi:hypothetical protein